MALTAFEPAVLWEHVPTAVLPVGGYINPNHMIRHTTKSIIRWNHKVAKTATSASTDLGSLPQAYPYTRRLSA